MLEAFHILPVTAGEVGEFNGSAVVVHGERAEFSEAAPFSEVVNVHVEGQTVLETVNHAGIHHVVHTAVSHFATDFTVLLDDGVLIFLHESLVFSIRKEAVAGEVVHLRFYAACGELALVECDGFAGIFGGITLRTGELEETVVGLGIHDVVLDFHDLTVRSAHEGGGVVTVAEVVAGFAGFLFDIFLSVNRLGVHGNEGGEAVTAVNVKALSDGTEAVSGIDVTTILLVVLHAPAEFLGVVRGVLPVPIPEVVEVVDVGTFCTEDFTEDACLCHGEGVEFVVVVAAVLKNHAVLASLLREVDELPALVKVHGGGHFDGSVLAILEGALSHGEVVIPVGSDIDEVDVGALAEFHVTVLAGVDVCGFQPGVAEHFLASFCTCGFIVAESHDFHTGNVAETIDSTGTTHAETHECHANGLNLRSGQIEDMSLTGSTLGAIDDNCTLVPMPLRVR